MTEENCNYRTSQILLRNQFPERESLKFPIIPKFVPKPRDFDDLLLIGFNKTYLEDRRKCLFQTVATESQQNNRSTVCRNARRS